ncbi:MAG TPA: adenylate/guanylate cyclase domain-containing protein [Burkholderiales bacterium]|nr:adenylate/guanylate cyclase domain-containing protein [Burkholderiales bacterium]
MARVLAILFADVSGSTALYESLGDRRARKAVEALLEEMRAATSGHGGRVVKTLGDEIMAVFETPESGTRAAIEIQERVSAIRQAPRVRVGVRVGLHAGEVLEEDGDVFGDAVNTAARMAGVAKSGQIVTTAATAESLPAEFHGRVRDLEHVSVKGKQSEIRVCEVLWQDDEDLTVLSLPEESGGAAARVLVLEHGNLSLTVDASRPAVLIGRDAASDIVIAHPSASRLHGRIERRLENFFYVDLSTNGTYVAIAGDDELRLRRQEIMLRGEGRLAYGHPARHARAEVIRYRLV